MRYLLSTYPDIFRLTGWENLASELLRNGGSIFLLLRSLEILQKEPHEQKFTALQQRGY